ncbi:MAG: glycosyltransferase family 4 protein [Nanopusillaceae archaeon]
MSYRVLIEFPWRFVDSQYYRNLILYPPENIFYINKINKNVGLITNPRRFLVYHKTKGIFRFALSKSKISIPILKFRRYKNVDLVHGARCIPLYNNSVIDAEYYISLFYNYDKPFSDSIMLKILSRKNIKKILPWTYASYYSFPDKIRKILKEKFEVVYPAVPRPKVKKLKHDKLTVLFIGRYFYAKGGLYALKLFEKLKKEYDIRTILISMTIPDSLYNKYSKIIEIYKSVSSEKLYDEIYPSTDILFYPGFSDSFGFAFVEALSYGIPIITYDGFSRREIIEDGKEGFVIDKIEDKKIMFKINEKLFNEFYEKIKELIDNPSLLKEFSRNAYKKYEEKFSIEVRNKKLKEIYEEAIGY